MRIVLKNEAKSRNLANYSEYFLDIGCSSRHIGEIASKKNFIAVGLNIDKKVIGFDGLYVIGVSEFLHFKKNALILWVVFLF